jgi:hypothetical protein
MGFQGEVRSQTRENERVCAAASHSHGLQGLHAHAQRGRPERRRRGLAQAPIVAVAPQRHPSLPVAHAGHGPLLPPPSPPPERPHCMPPHRPVALQRNQQMSHQIHAESHNIPKITALKPQPWFYNLHSVLDLMQSLNHPHLIANLWAIVQNPKAKFETKHPGVQYSSKRDTLFTRLSLFWMKSQFLHPAHHDDRGAVSMWSLSVVSEAMNSEFGVCTFAVHCSLLQPCVMCSRDESSGVSWGVEFGSRQAG